MQKNKINVRPKELERFLYTSDRYNIVRQFWLDIVKNLPPQLKSEIKRKPTNLVEDSDNCDEETKRYYFLTKNGSSTLLEYLRNFQVEVL